MRLDNRQMTWSWLAVAALFFFAAQNAVAAIGTVVGSKHDFSTSGPNATYKGTGNQVCVYCHAPHSTPGTTPLWNHSLTAATFTLYSSPTLDAGTLVQPAGVSKLCLSCHDGTVAVDSFGGATGSKLVTGSPLLGTDLSNDHPIGFTYDAALVTLDPGLKATTTAVTIGASNAGTIATKMLVGGKMECASCHDVHNSTANTAVEAKLLKITTAGSALCLTCHNK